MEETREKTAPSPPPALAIDGTRIKGIRETKKLTQLYVASVVGVTTDTISRWENNRYPTIRRDNAEKLATALEVELEEILRQEVAVAEAEAPPPPPELPQRSNNRRRLLTSVFFVLVVVGVTLYFFVHQMSATLKVVRWLPRYAAAGMTIPVQIKVSRTANVSSGFILKEKLPVGWRLIQAAPSAPTGEPPAGEVKWLIPSGTGPVTVSYTVQLPVTAAAGQKVTFDGRVIAHTGGISRTEPVGGDDALVVGPYHWADTNGDGRIDDNEIMPAYYLTEEMKGFDLDWKTIEAIWSGKGYRLDPEKHLFVVTK